MKISKTSEEYCPSCGKIGGKIPLSHLSNYELKKKYYKFMLSQFKNKKFWYNLRLNRWKLQGNNTEKSDTLFLERHIFFITKKKTKIIIIETIENSY